MKIFMRSHLLCQLDYLCISRRQQKNRDWKFLFVIISHIKKQKKSVILKAFKIFTKEPIARNSEPKWAVFIFVTHQHTCQPVNKASVWLVYVLKGKRSGKPVVKPKWRRAIDRREATFHWAVGIKMAIVFTEHLMRTREAIKTVYSARSK